jgi:tetratricopeptide (TPR) repeat protein
VHRATCLLYLGRLDEAASCLEDPLARKETFPAAALYLGFVEFLRGNLGRADELARAVAGKTPKQSLAWYLDGFVAFERGDLLVADKRFARVLEIKESDGRALAGRTLAALEREDRGPAVEAWLDEARRLEPLVPIVILAGARWRQASGDLDGARREGARAIDRLRELGMRGWVPYFEKLRRRWGLEAVEGSENTSRLS